MQKVLFSVAISISANIVLGYNTQLITGLAMAANDFSRVIIALCRRDIGELSEDTVRAIEKLSFEQLNALLEATLLDFKKVADLEDWLKRNS
jgi:Domain of unknown function (DUF4351)